MVILISKTVCSAKRRLRLSIIFTCVIFLLILFLYRREIFGIGYKKLSYNYKAIYDYIAMIIDDRASQSVVNAVTNVLQHIPMDWKIQIMTPYQNWLFYKESSLAQFIRDGRVFLTPLEARRDNMSSGDFINTLLTSSSFWYQVQGDKVLLFQDDSVLCSNSDYNLTDFLQYDFIGAPWHTGTCCNGGISLRSRTKILEILESGRFRFHPDYGNEDGWFFKKLLFYSTARMPLRSVAMAFAVETVYHPRPFSVHKPHLSAIGATNMRKLCNECPEAKATFSVCQLPIIAPKSTTTR